MNDRSKISVSLTTLTLLSLTMTCNAYAGDKRSERQTIKQVRSCVSEIAKHADYNDASRAIHRVDRFTQKNLVELEIRIETTVYAADGELISRRYKSSCIVVGEQHLVDFRIDPITLERQL